MMKKVGMILFVFMILGCSSKQSLESQQFEEYYQIREQLLQQDEFEEIKDFSVALVYNQVDNQYRYDIVIDHPQIDMYDITAMVYTDENDEQMNHERTYELEKELYYYCVLSSGYERFVIRKKDIKIAYQNW